MSVSANTLFHFTKKENLLSILEEFHFLPNYSQERLRNVIPADSIFEISYIPLISFCDLRLTQLSNPTISIHTKDFGEFGIGFEKNWGIKNKVSPAVYVHSNSRASSIIDALIKNIRILKNKKVIDKEFDTISELIKFLKPYDGHYQRGKWKKKLRRYYDEREWRFIPDEDKFPVVPEDEKGEFQLEIQNLNLELKKHPLKFEPADIKYLIVKGDGDKDDVAEIINNKTNYNKSIKTDIITKMITLKQIEDDY